MSAGRLVLGYHGCDATTRDDLVSRKLLTLDISANDYDWLGDGIYFFEDDEKRALLLAQHSNDHPDRLYTKRPIGTPAVVGAVLSFTRLLDMTSQDGIEAFIEVHQAFSKADTSSEYLNDEPGENDMLFLRRRRDRAVFNTLHQLENAKGAPYDGTRASFRQGAGVSPHSGIHLYSHTQLAVKNPGCILGWFMPPGAKLMTPAEYQSAVHRKELARKQRTAAKKRVRAQTPAA